MDLIAILTKEQYEESFPILKAKVEGALCFQDTSNGHVWYEHEDQFEEEDECGEIRLESKNAGRTYELTFDGAPDDEEIMIVQALFTGYLWGKYGKLVKG